ncbi:glutathione S-transferase family protein [Hyphococcus flavus]|uniref:Glutathione S-transferase family protein n=1 Tax=Hyphococcus flavus TaxID=1866326 RepID=A0AAE9ZKD0_9PROT|nr:glutathione S-transferase family protein [Hyphococcus flavus]WDI32766.1 glutathione S-transferase family protein [Hyphococcus flavus]
MSLKLIHFPMTRSLRVAWAGYELGLELDIETRPFDRPKLKDPEYLKLNPLGKTPVFFDGDKRMVESVAIIEYLANKYADGALTRNVSHTDYGDYLQWMQFGEAGMGLYVSMLMGHTVLLPEEQRIEVMKIWSINETTNCLNFIEAEIGDKDYLLGDFSLCDISVGYLLFLLKVTRNGNLMGEKTSNYFNRIRERDAWKQASALQP